MPYKEKLLCYLLLVLFFDLSHTDPYSIRLTFSMRRNLFHGEKLLNFFVFHSHNIQDGMAW